MIFVAVLFWGGGGLEVSPGALCWLLFPVFVVGGALIVALLKRIDIFFYYYEPWIIVHACTNLYAGNVGFGCELTAVDAAAAGNRGRGGIMPGGMYMPGGIPCMWGIPCMCGGIIGGIEPYWFMWGAIIFCTIIFAWVETLKY
jgi:hypothetical protein